MDGRGFYGDTFSSGFGDFYTAKRSDIPSEISHYRHLIKVYSLYVVSLMND